MNIQNYKIRYTPNFQALHVADCNQLKLYKITSNSDLKFLKALPFNIKMENLMPKLSKDEYSRWNEMLEYAVDNAQKSGNTTYIETFKDKICGIITFTPGNNTKLDCICTWPIEFGQKVKLAGQTLFYQMFSDFQKLKGKKIKLEAITNGPYDTISKYEKLGFKATSNVHPTKTEMEITAPKIKDMLKELSNILEYKNSSNEQIDLFESINM